MHSWEITISIVAETACAEKWVSKHRVFKVKGKLQYIKMQKLSL